MSILLDIINAGWDYEAVTENTDNQALSISKTTTFLTCTGAGVPTLADGEVGQLKYIIMVTTNAAATVTPATAEGFTTIVMDAKGEWVILRFNGRAWKAANSYGATIA